MDPAIKYRDKVDPLHKAAMDAVWLMHDLLLPYREQYERVLEAEKNMHSFGGMLDPTLYCDLLHSKSFAAQLRLIRAALAFVKEIEAVKSELSEEQS